MGNAPHALYQNNLSNLPKSPTIEMAAKVMAKVNILIVNSLFSFRPLPILISIRSVLSSLLFISSNFLSTCLNLLSTLLTTALLPCLPTLLFLSAMFGSRTLVDYNQYICYYFTTMAQSKTIELLYSLTH